MLNPNTKSTKMAARRYFRLGVGFGVLFPIGATFIQLVVSQLPFSLTGLIEAQRSQPLLWIIDSAPLLLGLFAHWIDQRQDALQTAYANLDQLSNEIQKQDQAKSAELKQRTAQLKTSFDVGRAATSILDTDRLLREVVNLITDRFNFYYAAVFTLDATGGYALLREATGEAGRTLKQVGHKLEVGGQSMVGTVINTRTLRIALDVGKESVRFANPLLPYTRSEIALPLLVGDRVLGALDVQSQQAAAFDEASAEALQSMADQIAVALLNAASFIRSEQQTRTLELLNRLSRDLATATSLESISRATVRTVIELIGPSRLFVALRGNNPDVLAVQEYLPDPEQQLGAVQLIPRADSIIGQTMQTKRTFPVPDMELVADQYQDAAMYFSLGITSGVAIPMQVGEQVLGTFNVGWAHKNALVAGQISQLEQVAAQLAIAIENRELLQRMQSTLTELDAVNRRLIGQAWERYARTTASLSGEWREGQWRQAQAPHANTLPANGLRIPIQVRGESIGEFNLTPTGAQSEWTADDITFAQSLIDQVGQTIENARLLEDSEINLQETTELYRAGQAISAAQTYDDILRAFVNHILAPQLDSCQIVLIDPNSSQNDLQAVTAAAWSRTTDKPAELGQRWQVNDTFYLTHEPHVVADTEAETGLVKSAQQARMKNSSVKALASVPLLVGSQTTGWLVIQSHAGHYHFSERELRQYHTLAAQAATVLENRRLFENVEARVNELSVLTRIGRRIASTLDLDEVLSLIVEETIGATHATHASLALYNETENALEVKVMRGFAAEIDANTLGLLIRPGQGLHGRLLITGQSVLMNDVQSDPGYMEVNTDTRSEFIVPIRQGDLLLGALNLESPTVNAFDEADRRLIEALADQAAVAIANARSYDAERQAVERMREVDRLKTQFLANMSHELRTPLNSIIGFSRVIMRGIDGPLTELQMTDLQSIYNSGQHLLGLINNILDLSKIEAGKMELANEPIDLRDIARGVMSTVIALVKDRSVKLEQEIPDNLPPITADPTRVRQILLNLVSNAAKFTEQGKITLRVVTNPQEVQIAVIDTGMGIPADKLEHVFEEFTQVDASTTRRVGGTGLGLAITRRFVEMHGGRIWVESQPGVGSTFTFTLPRHLSEEPAALVGLPIDLAARDAGKKVILSIDDDPGVITLYKRYLEKQGYLVIGLTDPSKAIDEAKRLLPFAITLDIMMPSRDGWSLLADLKSTPEINRVPIVVCSIIQDKTRGYSLGATEYLVKPITEDELLHTLNRVSRHNTIQNVLVIDDEPTGILLIKRILEANGNYQILEASGGKEGIARLQADRPDLIILDLMMPDVDGFSVLETIQSNAATRSIPVIVVTAKEITREDRDRLNGHAVALFNKGMFTADQLLTELVGALKQLNGADAAGPVTK